MTPPAPLRNRVLVVEDSHSQAPLDAAHLHGAGFAVDHAANAKAACRMAAASRYTAVLLDPNLADRDGLELIKQWRALEPTPAIIVVTANASIAKAVEAIRAGAVDYLVKPVARDRLTAALTRATGQARGDQPEPLLPLPVRSFYGLIGDSEPMRRAYRQIGSVSRSKACAFITGETGTGKELAAYAIHALSPRAEGPFIAVNCAAIPCDLMESEIFGHLKGSFTGAIADRDGAARLAHRGTLFLDEICDMDLALQAKLLRFLDTGLVARVGETTPDKVDVRVVCATNKSPLDEVRNRRFRDDLSYRVHGLPISLPPLRKRGGDVVLLARHFLALYAREEAKSFGSVSAEAEAMLLAHSWPGNVRELQNVIRQAVVFNDGATLTTGMLPPLRPAPESGGGRTGDATPLVHRPAILDRLTGELWRIERHAIENAIAESGGSIPRAARVLGVSPSTLYRKLQAWQSPAAGSRRQASAGAWLRQ